MNSFRDINQKPEPGFSNPFPKCFGTPFIFQISGSGLVAPCGKLFNDKYAHHHIDNIANRSFTEIWSSKKYWEKHNYLHSDEFTPQTMCGNLCLQHKVNEKLFDLYENDNPIEMPASEKPIHYPHHVNFV